MLIGVSISGVGWRDSKFKHDVLSRISNQAIGPFVKNGYGVFAFTDVDNLFCPVGFFNGIKQTFSNVAIWQAIKGETLILTPALYCPVGLARLKAAHRKINIFHMRRQDCLIRLRPFKYS